MRIFGVVGRMVAAEIGEKKRHGAPTARVVASVRG